MQWYEIVLIAAAVLFVIGVAVFSAVRKKQGKGSCGCDCAHCAGCSARKPEKKRGEQ